MEPITTTALTLAIWEHAIKPVTKSIEKEYGEAVKNELKKGLDLVLSKFSLKQKESEVIETEIFEMDKNILIDEKKFLEVLGNNKQINDVVIEVNSRNKKINIKVKKGVGYIDKMEGDIHF